MGSVQAVLGTVGSVIIGVVLIILLVMCCLFELFVTCFACCNPMEGGQNDDAAIEEGFIRTRERRQRLSRLQRNHMHFSTM